MTNDQIKELAAYGAQERLKELDAQRVKIDEERESLMAFLNGPEPEPKAASTGHGRKPMSAAARLEASKRMTKIWAKRRKAKRDAAAAEAAATTAASAPTPETPPDTPAAP